MTANASPYIIVKELASLTKVLPHADPTVNAHFLNLDLPQITPQYSYC